MGAVIGKGGETIKRLQQDTGVRIDVSKDDGDGDDRRRVEISQVC